VVQYSTVPPQQYEAAPQYKGPLYPSSVDFTTLFTVRSTRPFAKHPVFFVGVKPGGQISELSGRGAAHRQMRQRFERLTEGLVIPKLFGLLIGSRLAVYEYDRVSQELTPPEIPGSSTTLPRKPLGTRLSWRAKQSFLRSCSPLRLCAMRSKFHGQSCYFFAFHYGIYVLVSRKMQLACFVSIMFQSPRPCRCSFFYLPDAEKVIFPLLESLERHNIFLKICVHIKHPILEQPSKDIGIIPCEHPCDGRLCIVR